jgi:histidinol-phosphate aminotransferase
MNWPNWLPLRDELRELSAYGAPQIDVPIRLNTNENPYSLSDSLKKKIEAGLSKSLANLNRYPDRDATELRSALAQMVTEVSGVSINPSQIWAANGSNEIIQTVCLAFKGDALGFEPSYSMHPLITKIAGKKWISIRRGKDFGIDIEAAKREILASQAKLIFVTTPNNPTGNTLEVSDIAQLAEAASDVGALLLVDEAYGEFANVSSAITLLERYPNILISRTMSKAFAFAGARLGYLIADPKIIQAIELVRLPYHLSTLTQAAALSALQYRGELAKDVVGLSESRDLLTRELSALGLKVYPSQANFFLFTGFKMDEGELWKALVDHGILIRDVGIPGHLRVTIGTRSENRAFLEALEKVIRG